MIYRTPIRGGGTVMAFGLFAKELVSPGLEVANIEELVAKGEDALRKTIAVLEEVYLPHGNEPRSGLVETILPDVERLLSTGAVSAPSDIEKYDGWKVFPPRA